MAQAFYTPSRLIESPVRVLLLGTGGTGSEALDALARIHCALLKLGHPGGLQVTAMDGDVVSPSNVGRQRFSDCDVNHPKAHVLIHRYNLFFGLDWQARALHWTPEVGFGLDRHERVDLLVTCVDRAQVRVEVARAGAEDEAECLWLDFGNGAKTAQCVLGHLGGVPAQSKCRLPNVFDLFPELQDIDDHQAPSCSLAEALTHQDLFINRTITDAGMSILWQLLHQGVIHHHGAFVNVQDGTQTPLLIDPAAWAFYGYRSADPTRSQVPRRS
jgi:PRTRC genetic system ThiF family protein